MKKIIMYFLLVMLLIVTSCQVDTTGNTLQPFFDINDFLEKELNSISNMESIKKKVSINDEVNQEVLTSFDLNKDLEIFRNSNINRIAWLDKYQVDSVLDDSNELIELKYSALDQNLKTQEFIVLFQSGLVNSLSIQNRSSNQVSSIEQKLKYSTGKGYEVESVQKVALSKEQHLKIEVNFIN